MMRKMKKKQRHNYLAFSSKQFRPRINTLHTLPWQMISELIPQGQTFDPAW